MTKRKRYLAAAVAVFPVILIGSADAATPPENDAFGIADAKIGLVEAITAAEQQVGGKASSAEYEQDQGRWVFEIEVVTDNRVMDVTVDPSSGKVLAAAEDTADHDDEEARDD